MGGDPIRLIERAYQPIADEAGWLSTLVEAGRAYDVGAGVLACTISLGPSPQVRAVHATADGLAIEAPIRDFVESMSAPLARAVLAPTEFVGNASWCIRRVLKARASSASAPPEFPAMWALLAGNGVDEALMLAFPTHDRDFGPDKAFPHRDSRVLGLVGAHLGSALRLRRSAGPSLDEAAPEAASEAILSPDGRVLDARGAAEPARARRALSEAVVRSERARGKLRRVDEKEAGEDPAACHAAFFGGVEVAAEAVTRVLALDLNRLRDAALRRVDIGIAGEDGVRVARGGRRLAVKTLAIVTATPRTTVLRAARPVGVTAGGHHDELRDGDHRDPN